ncbi:MAG: hypothetical protein JWL63_1768 [Rhodocyclales bacterium]|nr:hypothetical protein [Rhodocyclales bacterium]
MQAQLSPDEIASANRRDGASSEPPGVFDSVKSLGGSLYGLAHDHLRIISLETRLAGESLVNMIAAGVVLAVLVVSAWLMLVAIGVMLLVDSGVVIIAALLLAAAVNLGIAFVLFRAIRNMSHHLGFPATIRSLGNKSGAVHGGES